MVERELNLHGDMSVLGLTNTEMTLWNLAKAMVVAVWMRKRGRQLRLRRGDRPERGSSTAVTEKRQELDTKIRDNASQLTARTFSLREDAKGPFRHVLRQKKLLSRSKHHFAAMRNNGRQILPQNRRWQFRCIA